MSKNIILFSFLFRFIFISAKVNTQTYSNISITRTLPDEFCFGMTSSSFSITISEDEEHNDAFGSSFPTDLVFEIYPPEGYSFDPSATLVPTFLPDSNIDKTTIPAFNSENYTADMIQLGFRTNGTDHHDAIIISGFKLRPCSGDFASSDGIIDLIFNPSEGTNANKHKTIIGFNIMNIPTITLTQVNEGQIFCESSNITFSPQVSGLCEPYSFYETSVLITLQAQKQDNSWVDLETLDGYEGRITTNKITRNYKTVRAVFSVNDYSVTSSNSYTITNSDNSTNKPETELATNEIHLKTFERQFDFSAEEFPISLKAETNPYLEFLNLDSSYKDANLSSNAVSQELMLLKNKQVYLELPNNFGLGSNVFYRFSFKDDNTLLKNLNGFMNDTKKVPHHLLPIRHFTQHLISIQCRAG